MIRSGAVKRHCYAIVSLSIVLIIAGTWVFFRKDAAVEAVATAPVKVALARVNQSAFTSYVDAIGELEAVEEVSVPAEVGGRIVELPVISGQRVERGQVLVRLNDAPLRGERVRLQGQMKNAGARLERAQKLATYNAMSRQEAEDAQSQFLTAKGELQALEAKIDQLTISAPFNGTLGIRQVNLGQYVSPGQTLFNLVGSRGFYVNFSVPEQTLPHIRTGLKLQVALDSLPDQAVDAVITTLDPILDRSRMINVQARLQRPPEAALPRMFARVRVPQASAREVLSVPETAVTYNAYGEEMYVVQPATAKDHAFSVRRVAVKTGERRDGYVVVDQGLKPDDQVVVAGQIKLSDGAVIEAVEESVLIPRDTTARTGASL